jgi:hypothetical protein
VARNLPYSQLVNIIWKMIILMLRIFSVKCVKKYFPQKKNWYPIRQFIMQVHVEIMEKIPISATHVVKLLIC